MADVKFEKGSREWMMFHECWELIKKFYNLDITVGEIKEFNKKYTDIILSGYIANVLSNNLSEMYKKSLEDNLDTKWGNIEFDENSKERFMIIDYWKLIQKFWIPEGNEDYWDAVIRETDKFYKKHKDIVLTKDIAVAFVDSLDKKYRKVG